MFKQRSHEGLTVTQLGDRRLCAVLLLLLSAAGHASSPPQPVYPAGDGPVTVREACPTFSWSQRPDAATYEIAIYRQRDDTELDLVTTASLPGGTAAWTPHGSQCLTAGEVYVWALRATLPEGVTTWSRGYRFSMAQPSISEVARALEILQRYLSSTGASPPDRDAADDVRRPSAVVAHTLADFAALLPSRLEDRDPIGPDAGSPVPRGRAGIQRTVPAAVGLRATGSIYGVRGDVFQESNGAGVLGVANGSAGPIPGVYGFTFSTEGYGVRGYAFPESGLTRGVLGESLSSAGVGVYGYAKATAGATVGVLGVADSPSGHAGFFVGDVFIAGNLVKTSGTFKIDHPLDPANSFLSHSFVESPDMLNIYNGEVRLGEDGSAWVELPHWFDALNRDFRYQLTPIGDPAPGLFVSRRVEDNHFLIEGGPPGATVSWQVTGIRDDAYARAHPVVVEEDKGPWRGLYLYPELFGQPPDRSIRSPLSGTDVGPPSAASP